MAQSVRYAEGLLFTPSTGETADADEAILAPDGQPDEGEGQGRPQDDFPEGM
jgi:hypothetical protein